ncbi:hypothetical protein [Nocardia flavorosea]|nr:hypothetical protein [Nocardia flavorosea]
MPSLIDETTNFTPEVHRALESLVAEGGLAESAHRVACEADEVIRFTPA